MNRVSPHPTPSYLHFATKPELRPQSLKKALQKIQLMFSLKWERGMIWLEICCYFFSKPLSKVTIIKLDYKGFSVQRPPTTSSSHVEHFSFEPMQFLFVNLTHSITLAAFQQLIMPRCSLKMSLRIIVRRTFVDE